MSKHEGNFRRSGPAKRSQLQFDQSSAHSRFGTRANIYRGSYGTSTRPESFLIHYKDAHGFDFDSSGETYHSPSHLSVGLDAFYGVEEFLGTARFSEYQDLLGQAREIFGERLAKIIWREEVPSKSQFPSHTRSQWIGLSELRDAVGIAERLLAVEAKPTVRAWFAGKNPLLDDRAPAIVVRTDPQAVRSAARHFLAYG